MLGKCWHGEYLEGNIRRPNSIFMETEENHEKRESCGLCAPEFQPGTPLRSLQLWLHKPWDVTMCRLHVIDTWTPLWLAPPLVCIAEYRRFCILTVICTVLQRAWMFQCVYEWVQCSATWCSRRGRAWSAYSWLYTLDKKLRLPWITHWTSIR